MTGEKEAKPLTDAQWLRKLDKASAAHEKTRKALDELLADARQAGLPLTAISEHTPYSREWVRRIATRIASEREQQQSADSPQHP
ncbi:hypothetical protein [Actinacidiphila sp. ITFR-21]|uniref:hypothetical protein n=1 Tax=Actinacidiphila sp. ITFR-21 TaxID=3075199 RepID=UPI00288BBC31|nr:hypothetical protein [Streptomyces sp. ITFR-21]WNI15237.1 hypothetical protein RLT57_06590 [Streptomyces sp. ITFR-21]